MKVKDIFIKKLENAGYKNKKAFDFYGRTSDFLEFLKILEEDRDNVFHAMYGNKNIQNRGRKAMKEWQYRLYEAEMDLRNNMIPGTMFYLLTQIHNSQLKI